MGSSAPAAHPASCFRTELVEADTRSWGCAGGIFGRVSMDLGGKNTPGCRWSSLLMDFPVSCMSQVKCVSRCHQCASSCLVWVWGSVPENWVAGSKVAHSRAAWIPPSMPFHPSFHRGWHTQDKRIWPFARGRRVRSPRARLPPCFVLLFLLLLKATSLFLEPCSMRSVWKGMFHF